VRIAMIGTRGVPARYGGFETAVEGVVGLAIPPADPERPWRASAVVRAAFRWEPARAAAMRENALSQEVLTAFRRAIEGLGRR